MTYQVFERSEIRHTPREWLEVGQSIGDLANIWADRGDIFGFVGEGAGQGSPACFHPGYGELELNTEIAFGPVDPSTIGPLTDRKVRYQYPTAIGLIAHESFHARFTLYDKLQASSELTPKEFDALNLLEESRIEAQGIKYVPEAKNFIRASVRELLVPKSLDGLGGIASCASIVALIAGRVEAGVLSPTEVSELLETTEQYLGADLYYSLLGLVRSAQEHYYHRDPKPLYELAREWARLTQEAKDEAPESDEDGSSEPGRPTLKELKEKIEEALDEIAVRAVGDLIESESREDEDELVKERQESSKERYSNKETAREVFGRGTTDATPPGTRSSLLHTRNPTTAERVAAVTISQELERAKYHDRVETEVMTELPPGRLNTRALVQGQALKSRGVRAKTEPWRRTHRRHTIDPTLTVGVMVDISGSMNSAMEPMATTAWVMSEATRRVQGRVAMVYYGDDVFPTLKPGQHLSEVRVYNAPDGTEQFDKAFRSLDGALGLLEGSGARLLVIASDGYYSHPETIRARHWLSRCAEAGVAVLWLPFDHGSSASRITGHGNHPNVMMVPGTHQPEDVALEIGRAAALALSRAGL